MNPKNKGHRNFYQFSDLTKKVPRMYIFSILSKFCEFSLYTTNGFISRILDYKANLIMIFNQSHSEIDSQFKLHLAQLTDFGHKRQSNHSNNFQFFPLIFQFFNRISTKDGRFLKKLMKNISTSMMIYLDSFKSSTSTTKRVEK